MSDHDELASNESRVVDHGQREEEHGEYEQPANVKQRAAEIDCPYPVPEALHKYIIPARWGDDYITDLPRTLTPKQRSLALATIAAYYIGKYEHNDYLGGEVWSRAQEDFFDWSIDDFELLYCDVVNKLCDCLVERGVWIDRRKNASIARR
ncbi:hypothetical protein LZ31DRAFT_547224, partial [Colletotrichum somersetense]